MRLTTLFAVIVFVSGELVLLQKQVESLLKSANYNPGGIPLLVQLSCARVLTLCSSKHTRLHGTNNRQLFWLSVEGMCETTAPRTHKVREQEVGGCGGGVHPYQSLKER